MKQAILALVIASVIVAPQTVFAADSIIGTWAATNGESRMKISKCGAAFCSTIIWLKEQRKDERNENKALRERDLVGTRISENLKPAGENKWSGSVYSPRKGKTYKGFASVSGNKLTMKGCLTGAGFLCQTRKFNRHGN